MAAPVSEAERMFKASAGRKVVLNSNENPYGPPPMAREAISSAIVEGNRYPIDQMDELKELIAKKEGVSPDYVHVGAGSGDILCQTGACFGVNGGSIVSAYPVFPLMMQYSEVFKARWDRVNLNDRLEHDYSAMAAAIKPDTRLMFICNPNNPTGTYVDAAKVEAFCEEVSARVPVYSDEAYLEFLEPAQQHSMVGLVKKGHSVIVSRTFSKIYGMAGMRIGYIVARPDLIRKIATFEHDIPVTAPSIAAAKACLGDEAFMQMTRQKNAEARNVLTRYLDEKKIFYGKSITNFVFFEAPKSGKMILKKLDEKGFLIRVWEYQQREWCRVSIGTLEEMTAFVKAFDEVVS